MKNIKKTILNIRNYASRIESYNNPIINALVMGIDVELNSLDRQLDTLEVELRALREENIILKELHIDNQLKLEGIV